MAKSKPKHSSKRAAASPTLSPRCTNRRLLHAYWKTWHQGVIVLQRDWLILHRNPSLFFNPGQRPITELRRSNPLDFGLLSGYCLHEKQLKFILNKNRYPHLIDPKKSYYVAGDFNGWQAAVGKSEWELHSEKIQNIDCLTLNVSPHFCYSHKSVAFKFVSHDHHWIEPPKEALNVVRGENGVRNYELNPLRTGLHRFYFNVLGNIEDLGQEEILWNTKTCHETCPIDFSRLLLSIKSDKPLGAIIENDQTTFRVFSPRAKSVSVSFSQDLEFTNSLELSMELQDRMVWEITHPQNLHGHYYYYQVDGKSHFQLYHFDKSFKVLDPYAKATVSPSGPGIIVDPKTISQLKKSSFQAPPWHNLIIWETHIRDLLKYAPIELKDNDRLGFRGLTQWLKQDDCYIKKLGINAIEFLPIQEFDAKSSDEYHWGYMPTNYFSPASSYASDPKNASQVREFQELVKACHDANLAVIMDVVYNHVGEPNHLFFLDKYHYFEVNAEGYLMNYSGCGNDLRAYAPMTKRLIIDSLKHFVETYDVDGFRFDLAELIGVEVLLKIEKELKAIKPSIILIAEPWSFRGHIGHEMRITGYTSWNDGYRKFIADYVKGHSNQDAFKYFIHGSLGYLSRFPSQSVNYGSSHDDRCWLDKITENTYHNATNPTIADRRRTHLMIAVLMCSLGIPMIAQGTEILHTKEGVSNTYQRGDLNALNYERGIQYANTFSYFRKWIQFRLSNTGGLLRLEHLPPSSYMQFYFCPGNSSAAVLYNADLSIGKEQLLLAVNPHNWGVSIHTNQLDWPNFRQIADHERFNTEGLDSSLIPIIHEEIHLPPLSCGLWIKRA